MALQIIHFNCIDTSILFMENNYKLSLKNLSFRFLQKKIQTGAHDSYEDALSALELAKMAVGIFSDKKEYNKYF